MYEIPQFRRFRGDFDACATNPTSEVTRLIALDYAWSRCYLQ